MHVKACLLSTLSILFPPVARDDDQMPLVYAGISANLPSNHMAIHHPAVRHAGSSKGGHLYVIAADFWVIPDKKRHVVPCCSRCSLTAG
jgi:hypothetical protein